MVQTSFFVAKHSSEDDQHRLAKYLLAFRLRRNSAAILNAHATFMIMACLALASRESERETRTYIGVFHGAAADGQFHAILINSEPGSSRRPVSIISL